MCIKKENKNRTSTCLGMTQQAISIHCLVGRPVYSTLFKSCVPLNILIILPFLFPLLSSSQPPPLMSLLILGPVTSLNTRILPPLCPQLHHQFELPSDFDLVVFTPPPWPSFPWPSLYPGSTQQLHQQGGLLRPLAAPIFLGAVGWVI